MAACVKQGPAVDTWSGKHQRIIVSQPAAGFLYDLVLRAKIQANPDHVYEVLIDPNSHQIFRGIKSTLSRKVLSDDGKGCRQLQVGHRAVTKFLWVSVTFDTELLVWEDDHHRTIKFTNAREDGFMKKFEGTWHVQPFTQQTLLEIDHQTAHQQQAADGSAGSSVGPLAALQRSIQEHHHSRRRQKSKAALVTLEHAIAPRAKPPGPVSHLVRGLCARVLQNMMEDLRQEVARREQAAGAIAATPTAVSSKMLTKRAASLPVASITSGNGWSGLHSSSSWGSMRGSGSNTNTDNNDGSSWPGSLSLLSSAVPLNITIKL